MMDSGSGSDCDEFSFTCDKCSFITKDLHEIKKHTREHKKRNKQVNKNKNNEKPTPIRKQRESKKVGQSQQKLTKSNKEAINCEETLDKSFDEQNYEAINLQDSNKSETYQIDEGIDDRFLKSNINADITKNHDSFLLSNCAKSFLGDEHVSDEDNSDDDDDDDIKLKAVQQHKSYTSSRQNISKDTNSKKITQSEELDEVINSIEGNKQSETSELFKCAECSFSASSSHFLMRHERIHQHAKVAVDRITCEECEIDFKLKKDLVVHEFEIHNKPVPPAYHYLVNPSKCKILPDRYKCSYNSCDFTCKFLYMLTNHKKKHRMSVSKAKPPLKYKPATSEAKEDRYHCSTCGFVCKFKKLLHKHNQDVHKKAKLPKIGKRGSVRGQHCEYCKKYIIGSQNHYLRHMCIHTGEKPFVCDDCGKCYTEKASLNQHKLTHGDSSDYLCEDCGKAFKRAINLRMHKRIHLKNKPHECNLCDYKCRRRDSLGLHMKRKHLKEKRYLCDHCGKGFFSDQERSQHLKRKHLPRPMPFVCPICQEPFKFEYNMRAHLKTHPNYKPNKCSYCDFETRTKAALKDHIKKHTGEKTKSCDLCDYVTSTSSNLYKHRKRNHGINSIRPVSKLNNDQCATVVIEISNENQSSTDNTIEAVIPLSTIKDAINSRPVNRENKYTSNVISQALAEARIAQADVYDVPTCPPQATQPSQVLPQNLVSSIVPLTPVTSLSLATNLPIIPSTTIPCTMFPDNGVTSGMAANLVVATPNIPTANYYTNLMTYHNLQ